MKFFQFVVSLYPHMLSNFGRFILIFNKMALIFLKIMVSSFLVCTYIFSIYMSSSYIEVIGQRSGLHKQKIGFMFFVWPLNFVLFSSDMQVMDL